MLKIYPYKMGSSSAKSLAKGLRVKRIRPNGNYVPRRERFLILNWGCSRMRFAYGRILNKPEAVYLAVDKLRAFTKMKEAGVSTVEFTTDKEIAQQWQERKWRIVCRHVLQGSGGVGITVVNLGEQIPHAPLYTKYMRKDAEYRLHIFRDKVIDATQKKHVRGIQDQDNFNALIRNHANGWVFCRENINIPENAIAEAKKAVNALGLDFGAVDLIYRNGQVYILEVNCAPGLEGTTLEKYVKELSSYR